MISINLTTIPSRIGQMMPCLESLFNQTCPATDINLHVPTYWQRFGVHVDDVDFTEIQKYANVYQHNTDYGPLLKLMGALKIQNKGTIIIVDDDVVYPSGMTIELMPVSEALGYRGKTLDGESYKRSSCNYADRLENCDILTGTWGMGLLRQWFDFSELYDYYLASLPEANYCDDIVINKYLVDKGVSRCIMNAKNKPEPLYYKDTDALWTINKDADYNDTLITKFGMWPE